MADLLHELVISAAETAPGSEAVVHSGEHVSYEDLSGNVTRFASVLAEYGFEKFDRLAVYLPKQIETVVSIFGSTLAGGIFVPVNPVLKAAQVAHILHDSGAKVLVTTQDRFLVLQDVIAECPSVELVFLTDGPVEDSVSSENIRILNWSKSATPISDHFCRVIDTDAAGILYTSGSTGKPKGVVLSHRNLVTGAKSVSSYLKNNKSDRILAALPLSFDAGLSQVTTAFYVCATVVLHNHYFAGDVVKISRNERITGITAVPPLWAQIAEQDWPVDANESIRYFANTGGKMPHNLLKRLQSIFPNAEPYLMYGLTEAFRSTYLPPSEVDRRPDSIGKSIPNAEVLVVHEDGSPCAANEPGELVHRGGLVALGYWNAPEETKHRFRPSPIQNPGVSSVELAVWSGDIVRKDEDGFLYFVARSDEMIKTSGYRVSPTEIEEIGYDSGLVKEVAALGIPDVRLGQIIVVIAVPKSDHDGNTDLLLDHYRSAAPAFMVPSTIQWRDRLPKNANNKIDRQRLSVEIHQQYASTQQ